LRLRGADLHQIQQPDLLTRKSRKPPQRCVEKKVPSDSRTVGRQRGAVLAHAWQSKTSGVFHLLYLIGAQRLSRTECRRSVLRNKPQ
jgi:hypothetical protein